MVREDGRSTSQKKKNTEKIAAILGRQETVVEWNWQRQWRQKCKYSLFEHKKITSQIFLAH